MSIATQLLTWCISFLQVILNAFTTAPSGALTATVKIHLYNNVHTPSPLDTVSAYTECTYSGYAAASVTLSGPVDGPNQSQALVANGLFIATAASPFVPDTAQGMYVTTGTNTLIAAEQFAVPVPFGIAGAFLDYTLLLPIGEFVRP